LQGTGHWVPACRIPQEKASNLHFEELLLLLLPAGRRGKAAQAVRGLQPEKFSVALQKKAPLVAKLAGSGATTHSARASPAKDSAHR